MKHSEGEHLNQLHSNHGPHHRKRRPGYQSMLALLAVFLLPVGLAWLTLQQGWFSSGVNNHGQWVQGQINQDQQWRLLVPLTSTCAACRQGEPLLQQVVLALGRDSQRVRVVPMPANTELTAGFVYIADPPGKLVMRYPLHGETQADQIMAKALLSDLRRLLTHSRAG